MPVVVTEEEQRQFDEAVEHDVQMIERMIKLMELCPYADRNDQIAVLAGMIDDVIGMPEHRMATIGVTATVMLLRERRSARPTPPGAPIGGQS